MLYVLTLTGMGILLILLQLWLSSKKSVFPGLALVAAVCVVFLSLTVWAYSLDVPTKEETLTCSLEKDRIAEATITWGENNEIVSVTDISIKDKKGILIDEIAWGEYRLKDVQKKLKGDYAITMDTPTTWKDGIEDGVKFGYTTFSKNIFLWDLGIVTVPLLLLHLMRRHQLRRIKQREELEKMNIQEL
ncbi:Uncharacterised protein [uncultured Eubacterium sp.]|nr:Uncharacterised protein [uncultured Eubacterium sp.]